MSSSKRADLTPLQRRILTAFFERERGFFLTGGAALAGFHLHHRPTDDLDLFTGEADAFERGRHVLADIGATMGGRLEARQAAPGFKRFALSLEEELVVIDLVLDRGASAAPKLLFDDVIVDPLEEILANKLTAIVGRSEERDLVDVMFVERRGHPVEAALPLALAKDGGCTPATLAWILSELHIPPGARLPAGVLGAELTAYLSDLIGRLLRIAAPVS